MPPDSAHPSASHSPTAPPELLQWQQDLVQAITGRPGSALASRSRLQAHNRNLTGIRRQALAQIFPLARQQDPARFRQLVNQWLALGLSPCADLELEGHALLRAWQAGELPEQPAWSSNAPWPTLMALEQLRQLIRIGETQEAPYRLVQAHRLAPRAAALALPFTLDVLLGQAPDQAQPGHLVVALPPGQSSVTVTPIDAPLFALLIELAVHPKQVQGLPDGTRQQLRRQGWIREPGHAF